MQLELRGASKRFGERVVFEDLDADFPSGGVTALVGPSGSGKSTVLAVLAGFQSLDEGSVRMTSSDGVATVPEAGDIAWIPQGSNALGRRTVIDNVMIGALASGESLETAQGIARAALADVGLEELEVRRARQLSGGELQRVAVARAMASGRPMIFADEPTANLDRVSTQRVADAITAPSSKARIVILATHDPQLIDRADRVVDLRRRG